MLQSKAPKELTTLQGLAAVNQTSLQNAKVTRDFGTHGVEVEAGAEIVLARVGFGSLVRPIAGDRVLLSRGPEGSFVVAVLERLVPDGATLSLPSGGALIVEASGVSLVARNGLSIDAQTVDVRSHKFNVIADSLTFFGRLTNWVAEHLRVSARTQEVAADTLISRALDRVAIIEQTDVLRAGSVSQAIDGVAITTAPAVVIATSEDLRLDGKRVTVG